MVNINKDNINRRLFSGWGSISVVDKQGDYIDVLTEFRDRGIMEIFMARGATVIDSHSNHPVGKIVAFEYKMAPSGQPGLYLTAEIFNNYETDHKTWQAILDKQYTGFSLGGRATDKTPVCDQKGCYNNLTGIENWEWSIVESPANQEALIDSVNKLAKGIKVQKARVYVKYPADAPQGSHIYTGDKGGKYYETEEIGNKSTREQIEREQKAPKIKVKSLQEILGDEAYSRMDNWKAGRELKDLLNTYIKISSGTANDEEINRNFDLIKRNLHYIYQMYANEAGMEEYERGHIDNDPYRQAHKIVADKIEKLENEFNTAKDRKDRIIAIDNFIGTAHTSGPDIIARIWNAKSLIGEEGDDDGFAFVSHYIPKYMDYLRTNIGKSLIKAIPITKYIHQCDDKFCVYSEAGKKLGTHETKEDAHKQLYAIEINKSKAYIKKPNDAPPGVKVYMGSNNGMYYNTEDNYENTSSHSKVRLKRPSDAPKGIKVREDDDGFYYNSDDIQKAKIYVQDPSEAPQGSRIQTGKHGGKYYESETQTSPIVLRMRVIESHVDKILQNYDKLSKNALSFEDKIIFANNLLNLYNRNKKHADHLDVPKKELEDTIQLLSSNDIHDKAIGIDNFMGLAHYSDLFLLTLIQDDNSKNYINISDEELDDEWKWKEQLSQKILSRLNEIRNRKGLESRTFRKSNIQKARVYVKTPAEAPSGLQIHVGPEGGKYYETEDLRSKQRQKVEREQHIPKIDIKSVREVVGEQLYNNTYDKEVLPLLETYGKIATGKASDDEVNEVAEVIKRRLPNVLDFYVSVINSTVEPAFSTGNFILSHQKVIDDLKDIENKLNTAKDRKDKIIAIDNFMQTAHTGGDNVVRRLWNRPSYTGDVASKYLQYLRETAGKIQKAKVYVKNPSDAPPGVRLQEGKHGGHYYETEARQPAQQEAPKEKRNLDALNPRIYDNYDKLLHFETGKEVLINYLHNTEKAPNMGSRFGQDIEPKGKYVILDEMGVDETVVPPGWKKSAQILHNPLVLDWKDWKQRLSSFYGNLIGKNLSDALKADGFDGIVTIDGENISEIVLLKPRIESYNELKATPYYKGSTEIYNDITKLSDKYDVFDVNAAQILVSANDPPTDIGNKVLECSESFKFSSLKSDKPVIKFLGKTYIKEFNWRDRDGKDHTSTYGGTANYVLNEIHIYDDYEMDGILHHEVGHFVYQRLMSSVDAKPDPSIKSIADIDSVDDYRGMVEILKTHNVLISSENIEKILDDINYARELGIMADMHTNNLTYYDKGYGALYGILHRLKENRDLNITPFEEKQWKKYRTLRKQELKSNTLRNEWLEIWQTEGYRSKEYANRNNGETFAEFYQLVDRILRHTDENLKHQQLIRLAANHPLKWAFFKKHVVRRWLK